MVGSIFPMATNELTERPGGKVKETQWHNIVDWTDCGDNLKICFQVADTIGMELGN